MTALTVVERARMIRMDRWWSDHNDGGGMRCSRCNRHWPSAALTDKKGRLLDYPVHHLRYDAPPGLEDNADLVGLCPPCHDRGPWSIHARHRRHSRAKGWMRRNVILNHAKHYATLPRFTRRWVRIGRAFAWRDGFPGMGRLPELDW